VPFVVIAFRRLRGIELPQDSRHNLTVKLKATEEHQDAASVFPSGSAVPVTAFPSTIIRERNQRIPLRKH
jgi:hypothetical protein